MPKTLTKRGSAAEADTIPLDDPFSATVPDAVRRWRAWATAVADGNRTPATPRELLDVAHVLGIRDPAEQLKRDAEAIAGVRGFDARAAASDHEVRRQLDEHGGAQAITARIQELTREIAELKAIASCGGSWNAVEFRRSAALIRKQTPRIYDDAYQGDPNR